MYLQRPSKGGIKVCLATIQYVVVWPLGLGPWFSRSVKRHVPLIVQRREACDNNTVHCQRHAVVRWSQAGWLFGDRTQGSNHTTMWLAKFHSGLANTWSCLLGNNALYCQWEATALTGTLTSLVNEIRANLLNGPFISTYWVTGAGTCIHHQHILNKIHFRCHPTREIEDV